MVEEIKKQLEQIEKEYNCEIIYAIEAGSRVWGYHSENSDYDVRFIYKQSLRNYCSIMPPRQVIDKKSAMIELHGWDLLKTLQLYQKSNPSLYEWLASPIIYVEESESEVIAKLRDLTRQHYSFKKLGYHYLSLATRNFKKEYQTAKDVIQLCRAILMVKWMIYNKELPPLSIEALINTPEVDATFLSQLKQLITTRELEESWESDNTYIIMKELEELPKELTQIEDRNVDAAVLNELFWGELGIL